MYSKDLRTIYELIRVRTEISKSMSKKQEPEEEETYIDNIKF